MHALLGRFSDVAFTLLRIVFAFLYWSHGPRWLFGAFGGQAPAPTGSMFWVAGILETTLGIFIAVGLFTSWAAFIACGEMAFAYFIAHVPRGSLMPIENGGEITVALCFGFLYLATRGGGSFSIDRWIERGRRRAE